jgi:excisionase family DNA binding protein
MTEAATQLGTTRKNLYALIARGELASVTMGRRRYITSDELERFIAKLVEDAS